MKSILLAMTMIMSATAFADEFHSADLRRGDVLSIENDYCVVERQINVSNNGTSAAIVARGTIACKKTLDDSIDEGQYVKALLNGNSDTKINCLLCDTSV